MIAFILRFLAGGVWKPLAGLLAALGLYAKGRTDARRKAALDTALDTVDALKTRGRIEDEIEQDGNLIDRARKSGLVRRDGH